MFEWRSKWLLGVQNILLCLTAKVFEKSQVFKLQSATCTAKQYNLLQVLASWSIEN